MRKDDIKAFHAAVGRQNFERAWIDLLEGRNPDGTPRPKLNPMTVSIQALYEALVGPKENLESFRNGSDNFITMQEQVESTAFPNATGALINAHMMDSYNALARIGDSLVTVVQSRQKNERFIGFSSLEGPLEVPEGMPYEESGFTERYVTTQAEKKGRIIEITEEAIFFDQTNQILMRAGALGAAAAQEREKTILAGVVDVGSGAAGFKDVYRPNGVATPLYTGATVTAPAVPLSDWASIDAVLQYHSTNMRDDRAVVSEREPILWNPTTILVSRRLLGTASRILSATQYSTQPGAADATSVMISGNPLVSIIPGLGIVSSPMVDYLAGITGSRYNDARDWFLGDFKKQFIWQEIWPIQTSRAQQNDEAAFRRDIVARFKVRYFGGIAALDNKWVLKVDAV